MFNFCNFLLITFYLNYCFCLSRHPLALVVSYDAFRHDFIDKGVTPTLAKLRQEGCYADYLENVFITKTFPNHASISTGLYPEVHGVMGNSFYDPTLRRKLEYSYEMWHYSDDVVPIWIANERKGGGRHSGVMMWPGNEYNYTGLRPTFQQGWTEGMPWQRRVDVALSWFQNPTTPANLVMLYLEEPDGHGHAFGPDSARSLDTLKSMEDITKYLLARLEKSGLRSKVNLFLVSDHGMDSVKKKDIIDLRPFVDDSLYQRYETSPTLHVFPNKGQATTVYDGLKRAQKTVGGFNIYRPEDLRPEWHYAHNRRTPPILLVADPPHVFHDFYTNIQYLENKYNFTSNDESSFGVHGYDNKLAPMRPYFIATGPNIREKKRVPTFRTIDLFAIWAELLGFPEATKSTNGSAVPALLVLKPRSHVSAASIAAGITGAAFVILAMAITVYFLHRKLHHKYQRLLQTDDLLDEDTRQRLLDSDEET